MSYFTAEKITDGTNIAAVKAASTPAVVADPALVVTISPNNAIAITQSTSPWVVSGAVTVASTTVTGTVAVTQSTSPWVVSDSTLSPLIVNSGSPAVSSLRVVGDLTNNNQAPGATNLGVLPAIALSAAPTYTSGDQVLLYTDLAGHLQVDVVDALPAGTNTIGAVLGTLTTNNAAPIANNIGVLPAVASTAAPTYVAGDQVLLSTDLSGNLRVLDSTLTAALVTTGSPAHTSLDVSNAGIFAVQGTLVEVYNSTPPTLATGQSVTAVQADSRGSIYVNTEGRKATYRMSAVAFIPLASSTSPTFSIRGSSTKIVRITHIHISWSCAAGQAAANIINLQKFSALTGGATGTTPTAALNDSANPAQTAVCLQYSTVPSVATAIGGISASESMQWTTPSATTYAPNDDIEWIFGNFNEQSLVLRGTNECFGIVVSAVATTTPLMTLWIEWTEE